MFACIHWVIKQRLGKWENIGVILIGFNSSDSTDNGHGDTKHVFQWRGWSKSHSFLHVWTTELNEIVIANTTNEFDLSIQFYIQLFDDSSTMKEKQMVLESNWNNHKKIFLERRWNIYSKFL